MREIERLKKDKGAVIVAHNYQLPEVQDVADFTGDSLELAVKSANIDCRLLVFCGVTFMAETAKILSPDKKVVIPEPDAGCPLADMVGPDDVRELKQRYPDAWVVSYVNTNAAVKALTDVCCTSANADRVVGNIPARQVIFLPDKNLCRYVRKRVQGKEIICWHGYCYVHDRFTADDITHVRQTLPGAEIMVHPECPAEVQDMADGIYSTSGMLKRARESGAKEIVIGTEEGLLYRIQKENPGKKVYSLGAPRICSNMKKTTVASILRALEREIHEVDVPRDLMLSSRKALERMIEYT